MKPMIQDIQASSQGLKTIQTYPIWSTRSKMLWQRFYLGMCLSTSLGLLAVSWNLQYLAIM